MPTWSRAVPRSGRSWQCHVVDNPNGDGRLRTPSPIWASQIDSTAPRCKGQISFVRVLATSTFRIFSCTCLPSRDCARDREGQETQTVHPPLRGQLSRVEGRIMIAPLDPRPRPDKSPAIPARSRGSGAGSGAVSFTDESFEEEPLETALWDAAPFCSIPAESAPLPPGRCESAPGGAVCGIVSEKFSFVVVGSIAYAPLFKTSLDDPAAGVEYSGGPVLCLQAITTSSHITGLCSGHTSRSIVVIHLVVVKIVLYLIFIFFKIFARQRLRGLQAPNLCFRLAGSRQCSQRRDEPRMSRMTRIKRFQDSCPSMDSWFGHSSCRSLCLLRPIIFAAIPRI